ncbi:MAG: hypothetical protein SGCHY_000900 [Lobulomycetales sp.]
MKRLKRQRQEAARAALEAAAAVPTDDSDGSVQHNRSEGSAQQNPFDLLDASHSADSEPSEEDKDIVNDEHALPSTAVESDLASAGAKKNSGRKMTKKKKKKSKKQPISQGINDILLSNCVESGDSEGLDDIDRYLKELDGKSPSSSPSLSETLKGKDRADSGESADAELLSVDKKNLDANVEMRRMFGSRVVNSQMERNARRGGAARANTGVPRSLLTNPTDFWPRITNTGIDMEIVQAGQTRGESSLFSFTHSNAYKGIQKTFFDVVATHDPNRITFLVQQYPYHIDSLLQLSEISRQSGNVTQSAELVERAVFAFEKALHPSFNIAKGLSRLDFRRVESRPFFLCIFRHMNFLARKGCWSTAFEFCRLLLSLDPVNDPLGAKLIIDLYALKSGHLAWLEKAYTRWRVSGQLNALVNWRYTLALAKWQTDKEAGTRLLLEAVTMMPFLVPRLLSHISAPDAMIEGADGFTPAPADAPLVVLCDLYIERASSLWKGPEVLPWLVETARAAIPSLDSAAAKKFRQRYSVGVPLNFQRHVYISELTSTVGLSVTTLEPFGLSAHDPVPPRDAIPDPVYQAHLEGGSEPRYTGGAAEGFLRSLVPWMEMQQQNGTEGGEQEAAASWMETIRENLASLGIFPPDDRPEAEEDAEEDD